MHATNTTEEAQTWIRWKLDVEAHGDLSLFGKGDPSVLRLVQSRTSMGVNRCPKHNRVAKGINHITNVTAHVRQCQLGSRGHRLPVGKENRTSECSIDKPNTSPRRQTPASRIQRKGIAPSGKMFEVATSNAGVHFQLEVHFVHRNSTGNKIQRMQHRSLAERDVQQPWRPNHYWELQTATGLLLRRTRHCSCPLRSRVFTEMH